MSEPLDQHYMQMALELAERACAQGEVPVGAVLVLDGEVIGKGQNSPIAGHDPTAHAEIQAIRDACSHQGNYRLPGSVLYVTLEPCTMCVGALVHARVAEVVYGAADPKSGALGGCQDLSTSPAFNHSISVRGGVLEEICSEQLRDFFRSRRAEQKAARQENKNR